MHMHKFLPFCGELKRGPERSSHIHTDFPKLSALVAIIYGIVYVPEKEASLWES